MRHVALLIFLVLAGCTTDAVNHSQRLAEIEAMAKGHLRPLLRSAQWSGNRLRVTGMQNDFPVTESIGDWHIDLVPSETENVVKLQGLVFAKNYEVLVDLDNDELEIDGLEFKGHAISGESPMFEGTPFEGVAFERLEGSILGSCSIIFLSDGRTCMDFDKIVVNGERAREYGVLSPK